MVARLLKYSYTKTVSFAITRTAGANINGTPSAFITGKTCQIRFNLVSDASVASGQNVFTGTMPAAFAPVSRIMSLSYYGNGVFVLDINPSGAITVRNASDHAITISGGLCLTTMYTLAKMYGGGYGVTLFSAIERWWRHAEQKGLAEKSFEKAAEVLLQNRLVFAMVLEEVCGWYIRGVASIERRVNWYADTAGLVGDILLDACGDTVPEHRHYGYPLDRVRNHADTELSDERIHEQAVCIERVHRLHPLRSRGISIQHRMEAPYHGHLVVEKRIGGGALNEEIVSEKARPTRSWEIVQGERPDGYRFPRNDEQFVDESVMGIRISDCAVGRADKRMGGARINDWLGLSDPNGRHDTTVVQIYCDELDKWKQDAKTALALALTLKRGCCA